MEKRTEKKSSKWILVAVAAVLVAAAVVGGIFLFGGSDSQQAEPTTQATTDPVSTEATEPVDEGIKLYWNVDGATYRGSQTMIRPVDSGDGLIYMQFAVGGEQVRLGVADRTLANKIDMLEVLGLVLDANGVVVDAKRVEEFTGGYAANRYFVTAVEGNVIKYNSASSLDGFDGQFVLEEDTKVWNVGGEGLMVGLPGTIGLDDEVIAVKDQDGKVLEVFVIPYDVPTNIYFCDTRMYDATTKRTTRERDVTGNYVYRVANDGQEKILKVKDVEIASKMDAQAARCYALSIDEDGTIIDVFHAGNYTGGGSAASWYHCTAVEGRDVSFRRVSGSNAGRVYDGMLARECHIWDVSNTGEWYGQPTELRVGDLVHCLLDSRNQICYIFVLNRAVDAEMYWNVERMYDSKTKLTTRTPDYDGWYRIKVAVRGEQKIVKTQDPDIVQKIDARAAKCFGLELDGDVITKFHTPDAVSIGGTWASWYDVTALDGNQITVVKDSTGDQKYGVIAEDCEIYNVAANAQMVGQVDQVRVGDRVHTLVNLNGEVCVIYIVNRYENLPIYWNYTRKYNSTTKQTTRTPDADGYYVFEMAHNGETVTVKTKSKKIANDIDSQAAKTLAMSVGSDGTVYRAIHPSNCINTKGGGTSSWCYVTSVSKYGFTTEKISNGTVTNTYKETKAWNFKAYNVSANFSDHKGEETELQVGDFVHCLMNANKQVVYAFVMTRYEDMGVYYNLDRMYDSATGETTRTPDADGVYTIQMAHDGQEVTVKTKDKAVATAIDEQVAKVLGIEFDKDGFAIRAVHAQNTVECKGGIGVSYATVTEINGNQVTTRKDGVYSTWTIDDAPNVFDVSTKYENNRGERTTLREGDFVHCLKGDGGKTKYIYVMSRITMMPEGEHTCQHVTEDVTWYAWDGKQAPAVSGYYYLTQDVPAYTAGRISIDDGVQMVICLNGHTIQSADRMFNIYGELTICDHKVDGEYKGKITSSLSCPVDAEGKTTATYGGMFYMYNSTGYNPVLNIYGGTLECTGKVTTGGIGYLGNSSADDAGMCTMNIYDGTFMGGQTSGNGAGLHISNGSVLNMYGGTISGCIASGNGAAVNVDSGIFNMEGGTLTGNKATEGANLRVSNKGTANISGTARLEKSNGVSVTCMGKLNMTGGFIGECLSSGIGNAILTFANLNTANSELVITGGTVDGNIRMGSNDGTTKLTVLGGTFTGNINVQDGNNTLLLGGELNLPLVNLNAGQAFGIHESGLADTSKIAVSVADESYAFTVITDANDEACFVPVDDTIYQVVNKENELFLESKFVHEHCTCGGNAVGLGAHTACDNQRWTPWTDDKSLPASGRIVLTTDVTLSSHISIANKTTLEICLNGHTISTGAANRAFRVFGNLNITDCQKNADGSFKGGITTNYTNTSGNVYGGVLYAYNEGGQSPVINIYGGNFRSTGTMTNGAIAFLGNKNDSAAGVATMNLYAGTFSGGNTTSTGGNFQITNKSVLNMYGGTISGGSATSGGNIYNAGCTVNLYGGIIENGTATSGNGANVGQSSSAKSQLQVSGTQILGGEAKSSGGSVNIDGGKATFTSGKISGGYTQSEGGNLRIATGADVTIEGNFLIEKGEAKSSGGNLAVFGKLTMTGGTIQDGTAGALGGNISAYANLETAHAQISITGGTIQGGTVRLGAKDGKIDFAIADMTVADAIKIEHPNVSVVLSGKLNLTELQLGTGATVTVGDLADDSHIGISMTTAGNFATITDANDEACFESLDTAYTVKNTDGTLSLTGGSVTPPPVVQTHTHCVCADDAKAMTGHTCEAVEFAKWEETTSLPTSGTYYLTDDVTVTGTVTVAAGTQLDLCLNGHNIEGKIRVFAVRGTLNLCDCAETHGTVTGNSGATQANGGVFYIYNNATFNLFGGTLTAGKVTGEGGIGCVAGGTGGVMNIYGGTITGGQATKTGGNLIVWDGATVNMYGGTISGGSGTGGGNVNVAKGTFNLFDGLVEDGVSSGYGGNVRVGETGAFNMSGGTITGGQAASGGGNVYGNQNTSKSQYAQVHISGGTITKGQSSDAKSRGGYINYGYTYLSGNPVISGNVGGNISNDTRAFTVEGAGLTEGASVYVDLETDLGNTVGNALSENDAKYVFCTDPGYEVYYDGGSLKLKASDAHRHCICNETDSDHTHESSLKWTKWTETTALPTDSGNYVLTEDVTLSAAVTIGKTDVISICLNGHKITGCGTERVFSISGTLNITDCQKDSEGNYKGSVESGFSGNAKYGGIFYIYNKDNTAPIFNLYGGNLVATNTATIQGGGIGYLGNGANADGSWTVGQFNMYDGKLTGGYAGKSGGGALVVGNHCEVNIYGGIIEKCSVDATVDTANKYYAAGGAIMVGIGTLNLYDGTITGCSATGSGGNIGMYGAATVNVYGGEIADGISTANSGGNIYVSGTDAALTVTGGTISGGYGAKGKSGGSININLGTDNFIGGDALITGGGRTEQDTEAGNIRVANGAALTLGGDAIVEKGVASSGGNIGLFGTLNLRDNAIIRDGIAKGSGGNISMFANLAGVHAALNMTGGSILNGSGNYAGNIRMEGNYGTVDVTITGGTVSGGTATTGYPDILVGKPKSDSTGTGTITLTLGGTAKIGQINCRPGGQIKVSTEVPMTGESAVGVLLCNSDATTFVAGTVVTQVADAATAARFQGATSGWKLTYNETAKTLTFEEA